MTRKRTRPPGTIFHDEDGCLIRIDQHGEPTPFETPPYDPNPDPVPERIDVPRRADGTIAPFYDLSRKQLAKLGQDVPGLPATRTRHDGWTTERQAQFIERLAASASVTDAARAVGMSRQSARDLYNRAPAFRAAWDDALRMAVSVLTETAFDRAVNGVQEQVWHKGRMVGFREKYNDRLLMFLLRARDPLNYAPLGELQGWLRHRALEDGTGGIAPILDRLAAAEHALAAGEAALPCLSSPLDGTATDPSENASHVTSSTSSPRDVDRGGPGG